MVSSPEEASRLAVASASCAWGLSAAGLWQRAKVCLGLAMATARR
ncbi:uncharacterized protein G2W53_003856 [Senna tora]|uniref:Uncharacterized protein n=1 Tax=Senna tora TaxID=362788 RepID=A0A834XE91_9FABA|nr:uncharacterized protein G2W53_003856 [Senna tora]